mgnify:FL=1
MKNILIVAAMLTASVASAEEIIDLTPTAEQGDSRPLDAVTIMPVTPEVDPEQAQCLAEAIYFEGGNQSFEGMTAIGQVIMNRVASSSFPDTVCDVVKQGPRDGSPIRRWKCQFTFYCDGKSEEFPVNDTPAEVTAAGKASLAADLIMLGVLPDITDGSDHYHAEYVNPNWAEVYTLVAVVDSHLFYTSN